jgi:hypothetical protein
MSYQVVGQGQPLSKQRPGTVTAGVILMYVIAFLILVRGALGVIESLRYGDAIGSEIFPGGVSVTRLGTFSAILTGIMYTLIAAGTVATAVLVGNGRGPARVVAWCLTGVMALCCGCQSLSGLFQGAIDNTGLQGGGSGVTRALSALPSWINIADTAGAICVVLASIGVIVSLSVPAANDFFRKQEQVWVPPTWAGEPGYGLMPGAPTPYPQPPQIPQYPYGPAAPFAAPAPPPAEPPAPTYPAPPSYPAAPSYPVPPAYPVYPPAQPFPPAQPYPPAQPFPPANESPANESPYGPANEPPSGPTDRPANPS